MARFAGTVLGLAGVASIVSAAPTTLRDAAAAAGMFAGAALNIGCISNTSEPYAKIAAAQLCVARPRRAAARPRAPNINIAPARTLTPPYRPPRPAHSNLLTVENDCKFGYVEPQR